MRDRDAFGGALKALRHRLRDGVYAPGAPLVIIELAKDLQISATPTREALARLAGEGLIEDRRGWGFCVWQLGREDYEELYRLHHLYVQFALAAAPQMRPGPFVGFVDRAHTKIAPWTAGSLRSTTEAVFTHLVEGACQVGAICAYRSVKDRLAPMRLAEAHVFTDAGDELRRIAVALEQDEDTVLAQTLSRYHERRFGAVSELMRVTRTNDSLQVQV